MTVFLWILAVLLVVAGFAGLILPLLPGAPLLFLGLVAAAWAEDFLHVGAGTLVLLAAMAALTYVVDVAAGALGARRFGASREAMVGAAVGTVVGLLAGFVGVLVGPFIGAAVGELTARRGLRTAGRSGVGATIGLLLAVIGKLGIAFAMLGVFLIARFN